MNTAEWALVVAIAAAIISAMRIWDKLVVHRFTPPKLRLTLRRTGTSIETIGGIPTRYVHLEVCNSRPWNIAENVVVFVTAIERLDRDSNQWRLVYDIGPVPLDWQFAKCGYSRNDIGPFRYCDLGFLQERAGFKLSADFVPAAMIGFDVLCSGEQMRVHTLALGDNAASNPLVVHLNWNGLWSTDDREMAEYFRVAPVS